MSLEDTFHQAVEEWREHCRKNSFYSMPDPYLNCAAYRRIVALGPRILPLIREECAKYQDADYPGVYWTSALQEIIPDFRLPLEEKDRGRVDKIKNATLQWLEENMGRYVPTP